LDDRTFGLLPDDFGKSRDVRAYLQQWSTKHQQQLEETAPEDVQRMLGRKVSLPNALFARDNQLPTVGEQVEAEVVEHKNEDNEDNLDNVSAPIQRELKPGDLFFMDATRVRQQYAIYLGHSGCQAQYLLADGRWFVDTQTVWSRYIIQNFATEHEMSAIRKFLPVKTVEIARDISGELVPMHATGEVPLTIASRLLSKIASLAAEVADHKREHGRTLSTLHDVLAHESEFKLVPFKDIVRDYFNVDYQSMSEALKLMIIDEFFDNDSLLPLVTRDTYQISVMPKRMSRAVSTAMTEDGEQAGTGDHTSKEKKSDMPMWTGVVTTKSVKQQALDAIRALIAWQPIPVMRARMRLRVTCPTSISKQAARSKISATADEDSEETSEGKGTIKDRILSYIEQVESQDVLGEEWEVIGFVEPGAFKDLGEFCSAETRGRGKVEILDMAVVHTDD